MKRAAKGGGNGQKLKMALERNMGKNKSAKGSRLESNKMSKTIRGKERVQTCICTESKFEFKQKQSSQRMISNGSRLESNKKSMTIKGKERVQTSICTETKFEFTQKQSSRRMISIGSRLDSNKMSKTIQGKERMQTSICTESKFEFNQMQSSQRMISIGASSTLGFDFWAGSQLDSNKISMTIQDEECLCTESEFKFAPKQSSRRMISIGGNARRKGNAKK